MASSLASENVERSIPLGHVLTQEAVRVLVGSSLPRARRVTEIDLNPGVDREAGVVGELLALIPGE